MQKKSIYITRLLIILFALSLVGIIYYLFSPEQSAFFPQCPFHYMTGLDCPGCGSQRALHHLLHLEVKRAFFSNPLLIILIPYILSAVFMEYFGGKERYPKLKRILYSKQAVYGLLISILLFWIGRNLI